MLFYSRVNSWQKISGIPRSQIRLQNNPGRCTLLPWFADELLEVYQVYGFLETGEVLSILRRCFPYPPFTSAFSAILASSPSSRFWLLRCSYERDHRLWGHRGESEDCGVRDVRHRLDILHLPVGEESCWLLSCLGSRPVATVAAAGGAGASPCCFCCCSLRLVVVVVVLVLSRLVAAAAAAAVAAAIVAHANKKDLAVEA